MTLKGQACRYERATADTMQLRCRVHSAHDLWHRGEWIACSRCGRSTKTHQGRGQGWLSQKCGDEDGQMKLRLLASSDS